MAKIAVKLERDKFIIKMDPSMSYREQKSDVRAYLEKMRRFLENGDMKASYNGAVLTFEEEMELCETLDEFFGKRIDFCYKNHPPERLMRHIRSHGEELLLTVKRTVRGGEVIESNGDLIVIGDVNPAAKVYAAKSIYILGTLRGTAEVKSEKGTVFALSMRPEQIRIADFAAYNQDMSKGGANAEAYLENGKIYVRNL